MNGSSDPVNTTTNSYELDTGTNPMRSKICTSGSATKGSDSLLSTTSSSSSSQTVTRSPHDPGSTRASVAPYFQIHTCRSTIVPVHCIG